MSESIELPKGWATAPLGVCGTWYGGGTPSKFNDAYWSGGTIPWISPKDMKRLRISDSEDHISTLALQETNVKAFPQGTVLIVIRSGILSRTLPVAVADVEATMNQDLKGLLPSEGIESTYVAYFLQAEERDILLQCSKHGTTVASIDTTALHIYKLRFAPLNEQRRIVAKIEELFSDLDAGVAALKRAKANLKRYRASVLKAAVEGKLTEQWRAKHPATEPASALLARILKERRLKWEADQLAKFAAVRKEPPKNWRDKYVEPTLPDTNGLPELPEGWCWTSLDSLCSVIADIDHNMPKSDQTGVKFLSAKDLLDDGTLNFTNNIKLISEADYVRLSRKVKPQRNDIIYSRIGARLGKSRLVETDERFLVSYSCCTIRPIVILPKFLARYLDCDFVLRRAISDAQSIGVPDLGLEKIKAFAVPLCSIEEQNEIVAEMEQKLSVISVAEKEIEHGMLRAARLRQSILKRAFEGKLVPQDPKDEPASALLERLRTSRTHDEANGTAATSKRTRAKIKESSGEPRTRIRRRPSSQN